MSWLDYVTPRTYSTSKEVILLDRKLGLVHLTISLLVFAYVIGVRFIYEEGYTKSETAYGIIGVQLIGTSYTLKNGQAIPQDVASLLRTGAEGDAVFLPTRTLVQYDQKLGNCTTPDEPCSDDSDCVRAVPIARGACYTDTGQCVRNQWCNPGSDGQYQKGQTSNPFIGDAVSTNDEVLQDLGRLSLVITASVEFHLYGTVRLSNDEEGRTHWTIAQVLQRAGMTEEEAQKDGAVLDLVLGWDCPFVSSSNGCVPTLEVTQLAPGLPFYAQWANYFRRKDGTPDCTASTNYNSTKCLYRDLYQARGLRLLVSATGQGTQVSLLMIMQQLFVLLALLPIASELADFIMQNLFSERRHYCEYKTEQSPDFSDVRAKVEQLEKQSQSRASKAMNYA